MFYSDASGCCHKAKKQPRMNVYKLVVLVGVSEGQIADIQPTNHCLVASVPAGWGLDWLWPFLLDYPAGKIAIIDEVRSTHCTMSLCVLH